MEKHEREHIIEYLDTIAYRCYNTAVQRGKDVSETGCVLAVLRELKEFSQALASNSHGYPLVLLNIADKLTDDELVAAYGELISNTVIDERADVIIALATARYAHVEDHTFRAIFHAAEGAVAPVFYSLGVGNIELKMRYNELRKD